MKIRNLLYKVFKKAICSLDVRSSVAYRLFFLYSDKVVKYDKLFSLEFLRSYNSPKNYGECLCENNISNDFDLQIIIPAYNAEKYIEDCLNSILSQVTKYSYIITVVNDGSTDMTKVILKKYENLKTIQIIDQVNKGFSGARNAALKNIRAKYITFVDSDDLMDEGAIEAFMDAANSTAADIVEGGYIVFTKNRPVKIQIKHKDIITTQWFGSLYGYPWGKVYKAELFENIHFPDGYWFEDTICSFLIYPFCKKIATIDHNVYKYRVNRKGITNTSVGNLKCLDSLWITVAVLDTMHKLNITINGQIYNMFLLQVQINFGRIRTINNSKINRNVFVIHCNLRNQYFLDYRTNDSKLTFIEKSLLEKNYKHYYISCFLY